MNLFRWLLLIATVVVAAASAYFGAILFVLRSVRGEIQAPNEYWILAELLAYTLTPIGIGVVFLIALWRGGRRLSILGLAVAALSLLGSLWAAGAGHLRDAGLLMTYLVVLVVYFGIVARRS